MNIYNQILFNKLDGYIQHLPSSIENDADLHRKRSKAFALFAVELINNLEVSEAAGCIIDGRGDNGIDAIYIEDNQDSGSISVHIFQTKLYKGDDENKTIGENAIQKIHATITSILNGNSASNASVQFRNKATEIQQAIGKCGFGGYKIAIYFVYNGNIPNEREIRCKEELFKDQYFEVHFLTTRDLIALIDPTTKNTGKTNVKVSNPIEGLNSGIKYLVTSLPVRELAKIYNECGKENILNKNIRNFLGNSKINNQIANTIKDKDERQYFWFLNNGVTIICDYFETRPEGTENKKSLDIKNPSVINGGQTTRIIAENISYITDSDNATVLLRLYETQNSDLIDKITVGTNSQNSIKYRDTKANNQVQFKVKEYFKDNGYFLETKMQEYSANNKIDSYRIIKNDTLIQAYLSLYEKEPDKVKVSKGRAFEESFDKIFDENNRDIAAKLYRACELLYFVREKERKEERSDNNSYLGHAEFALLFLLGELNQNSLDTSSIIDRNTLELDYNKSRAIITKVVKEQSERLGSDYSHNNLFKNPKLKTYLTESDDNLSIKF